MQLTPDELSLDRINEALERGEDVVIKARKKVGPMQGPHVLCGHGLIDTSSILLQGYADMGLAFNTREQAETAKPIIRRYARMLNWVLANCPGHDPSGEGSIVIGGNGQWITGRATNYGGTYITMPRDKAIELCELLNSGEYTL